MLGTQKIIYLRRLFCYRILFQQLVKSQLITFIVNIISITVHQMNQVEQNILKSSYINKIKSTRGLLVYFAIYASNFFPLRLYYLHSTNHQLKLVVYALWSTETFPFAKQLSQKPYLHSKLEHAKNLRFQKQPCSSGLTFLWSLSSSCVLRDYQAQLCNKY